MSGGPVIVVDDDPGVLASLVSLLTIDGRKVRGFASPHDFLNEAADLGMSCVITDLRMPQIDGLTLIERLSLMGFAQIPVIVVSGHADVPTAVAAMQMGAVTVLEKPFPPCKLLEAVAKAIEGAVAAPEQPEDEAVRRRYGTLSPREREALAHLLEGASSKVVAIALGISPRTVDVFRANILRKMQARNLTAVATQAAKAGLSLERPA